MRVARVNLRLKKNGFYECADALCVVKSAVFPMRRRERGNFKNLYLLGLGGLGTSGGASSDFTAFYKAIRAFS
ncbi:MAG: hypothetical protein ACLVCW_05870 [Campylobacter sp.]